MDVECRKQLSAAAFCLYSGLIMISHSSSSAVLLLYVIGDSVVTQQSESTTFCLTTNLFSARLKRKKHITLFTLCK